MYSNLRPAPYSRACRAAPLLDATHPRRQRAQRLHATAPAGASDATTSCSDAESLPLVAAARRLYEEAWSQGNIRALNAIMAEDHAQCDVIWQPQPGIGRDRMKRGILAYRKAYPDVKFTVLSAAPAPGHRVFVHWSARGTNLGPIREQPPSGQVVEFEGISLLTFNAAGQIQESRVFRQAPADEMRYFVAAAAAAIEPKAGAGAATEAGR